MNIEELDGFFAALVAGPETVMPSEYYPHIFGGTMEDTCEFETLDQVNAVLGLMMRHWNTIAGTLYADEPYLPVLLEDEKGVALATDWARGFMRGVEMRPEAWANLINDEEHGGSILPMVMLCHEHDPDPKTRPNPITPEQRDDIIQHMAAGLVVSFSFPAIATSPRAETRLTTRPSIVMAARAGRTQSTAKPAILAWAMAAHSRSASMVCRSR